MSVPVAVQSEGGFVQGNLDGWGGWGRLPESFEGEQWGHSDPEYTWRILDELGSKR